MPVTCPHCSTRYVLPRALLGPGGARVRCPRCREPFAVSPEGDAIAPPPPPANTAEPAASHGVHTNGAPAATSIAPTTVVAPGPPRLDAPATPRVEPAAGAESAPDAGRAGPPMIVSTSAPRTGDEAGEIEKTRLVGTAVATVAASPAAETAPASKSDGPPAIVTPIEVARAVLDELATHSGDAIAASRDEGKVFREFGPVIAEAFEFYRRQLGPGADAAPFRTALRERWGVDLEPPHPTGRIY
jgi:predicted Zn finger-like uncharacterized protein